MEHRNTATVLFETGLVTLVMVLSFLGNLMVCHAIRRNPRLRCPSNYYLISLALTDIFQAVLVMPLSVFLLAMGRWPFGTPMCYVSAITKLSLSKTSLLTMALMALNRYYKIVRPASYQSIFTKRFIVITASAAWVTMVLMSLIFAFASDSHPQKDLSFAVCTRSFRLTEDGKSHYFTKSTQSFKHTHSISNCINSPVNAARRTSERLEDLCKTELRSTIETSDSPEPRPPPFQNMPTTPETSHSGTK